jgi:hypothetical protein
MSTSKAPISQRDLVPVLNTLIDAAMAKNSTAHRDIARAKLRAILEDPTSNWRTSYILNNIAVTRCRFIASLGYWIPSKWLLVDWKRRPGVDKGDPDE